MNLKKISFLIIFIVATAGCTTISTNGDGTPGQPGLHPTNNSMTQTHVNASAGWSPRFGQSSVVMPDGSIVLMGGFALERIDNTWQFINVNDVWRSTDNGATWTLMTADAAWSPRGGQGSIVTKDGRIVLIGYTHGINDIWSSTDNGATWEIMNPHAEWSTRSSESSVILPDGSIILTGGSTDTSKNGPITSICHNDVWRSTDNGATWKLITSTAGWPGRASHSSVVMPDGTIVLMGGSTCDVGLMNDVWQSRDGGLTWNMVNASAGWPPRVEFSAVVTKDGSIVLMGGIDPYPRNDVWRSNDGGATWREVNASAGWSSRKGQSTVVTPDDQIILMGGFTGEINLTTRVLNDVWESDDSGTTWKIVKKERLNVDN